MAYTKKEYTSNLHPKGDMDTTVYPNVKSENIIDKDTTAYTAGKVPDSSLVSKSLDGISENIETTKIQVATNKNNIETLQGNYTGLQYQVNTNSSDIALTKTQVETNKTNIAKNTQDIATNTQNIENLSAVIPTDINVDENGHVILEHDGTEITGQKKKLQVVESDFKGKITKKIDTTSRAIYYTYNYFDSSINFKTIESNNSIGSTYNEIIFTASRSKTHHSSANLHIYFCDKYTMQGTYEKPLEIDVNRFDSTKNVNEFFEYFFPEKGGIIALTSDLATKQATLYRHTVKISKPTDDGNTSITFTTSSEKNTPIDSIQNLTTVFGNTDLSVSGATFLISSSQWEFYNKIHVGTSINDTTVDYINKDDVGTYNFIDMFGTTGFTITDNVTAM